MNNQVGLLIIAYFFPPVGGAGVQRTVKFIKHLPGLQYRCEVIAPPLTTSVKESPPDASLHADLPADTAVHRLCGVAPSFRTTIAHKFLFSLGCLPRFVRWWAQGAADVGLSVCRDKDVRLIYATIAPSASALAAAHLSKATGIPWVADLRDPWALDDMEIFTHFRRRQVLCKQMRSWLSTASTIIMNTPEASRALVEAFPEFRSKRVVTITNGYDADDFATPTSPRQDGRFRIVHCGSFHTDMGLRVRRRRTFYRCMGGGVNRHVDILTRSHVFLMEALKQWQERYPEEATDLEVIFVGVASETDKQIVEQAGMADRVRFTGYLPHGPTLDYLRTADLIFLPLYNLPPGERARTVPGKTYEYMASGRPILAAVPDGDAKDFIEQSGTGFTCRPDDCQDMLNIVRRVHTAWKQGEQIVHPNKTFIEQFERRRITERLAAEFDRVLCRNGS